MPTILYAMTDYSVYKKKEKKIIVIISKIKTEYFRFVQG
jgi:hypothetical protein